MMFNDWISFIAWATAAASFAASLYIAIFVSAGWFAHRKSLRAAGPRGAQSGNRTFAILVPAHNEELLIGRTLEALQELRYPREQYRIFVVADNCTDATAEIARRSATVLVRDDWSHRGKGQALHFAIPRVLKDSFACDTLVIIDADTQCDPSLLRVLDEEMNQGHEVVQVAYLGSNIEASWRTRLQQAAWSLFNLLRPLGRVALGGSAPLLGNGMCFSRRLLESAAWNAFSITEDVEFAQRLIRSGVEIHFTCRTAVFGEMATSATQAKSQRLRWEEGRAQSRRQFLFSLLRQWLKTRRWLLLESALDLLFPPTAAIGGLILLAFASALASGNVFALVLACGSAALLTLSVLAGLHAAGSPLSVYLALLASPIYLAWKIVLLPERWLQRKRLLYRWVRTERQAIGQKAETSVKR